MARPCDYGRFRPEHSRPGVFGGGKDEVQPLQGVDRLMTDLLPLEQLHQSAVKLLQLGLLNLPEEKKKYAQSADGFVSAKSFHLLVKPERLTQR